MFFGKPGKATKLKKIGYLSLAIILGLFLSFMLHAFLEMTYINYYLSLSRKIVFYGSCALAPWLQITFLIGGVGGGFWLGSFWWRKLYVERVWYK
jgi:hypothetical protein